MIYPEKPAKLAEESSPSSKRESDRLDTQHISFDKISMHRRNPSQLMYHPVTKIPFQGGQKENMGKPRCSLQGVCSLLNPGPFLSFNKAAGEDDMSDEQTEKSFSEFSVAGQGLYRLPRAFLNAHANLKMLDLRDNKFIEFPNEIFGLIALKVLRLDGNNIRTIPNSIVNLHNLQILTLAKNKLKILDPILLKLSELTALTLNDNELSEWPVWISEFHKLRLLHIQGNLSIENIPLSLGFCENLNELGCDWLAYILPNNSKLIKKGDNEIILSELKELCRKINQENENRINSERDSSKNMNKLKFTEFIQHFKEHTQFIKSRSSLHMASMWGHIGIVKQLTLDQNLINEKDEEGVTPFILAVKYEKFEIVNILLENQNLNVSESSEKYGSALHLAILKGQWEIAEKIIKHNKFDPNCKDNNGNTALHLMFIIFDQDPVSAQKICALLLSNPMTNPNEKNNNGIAAAHYAAKKNQRHAIQFALQINKTRVEKFDFTLKGGKQGLTVLHFLVIYSDIELINEVLQSGIDLFVTDNMGRTARDIIRNSIIGRLLLRYEKLYKQNLVLHRNEHESFTGRESNGRMATHPDNAFTKEINRACIPITRNPFTLEYDTEEIEGKEYDSPVKLEAYSTAGPLMFANIHKMNEPSENIPEYSQVCVQINDTNPTSLYDTLPVANRLHSTTTFGNGILTNQNIEQTQENGGGDTERMLGATFKRPSLFGPTSSIMMNTLANPKRIKDYNATIRCPKEERLLSENKFSTLYDAIMNGEISKSAQYRYMYHMFKAHTSESEDILLLLCEKLPKSNPLKSQLIYLLASFKCSRAAELLASINPDIMPISIQRELCNSKLLLKRSKNYLPIKYESKQQRQEGYRASLLSQTHQKFTKGFLSGLSGTNLFTHENGNVKGILNRQVPSFNIRKTMNYFIT